MVTRRKRIKRKILRGFEIIDRPAAWCLLIGGFVTFVGVILDLIQVGQLKLPVLLIAADLVVSGFSAVQEAEDDEDPEDV